MKHENFEDGGGGEPSPLIALELKLLIHINTVLYSDAIHDKKREIFMNMFNHFLGNHTNCPKHNDTKT